MQQLKSGANDLREPVAFTSGLNACLVPRSKIRKSAKSTIQGRDRHAVEAILTPLVDRQNKGFLSA